MQIRHIFIHPMKADISKITDQSFKGWGGRVGYGQRKKRSFRVSKCFMLAENLPNIGVFGSKHSQNKRLHPIETVYV